MQVDLEQLFGFHRHSIDSLPQARRYFFEHIDWTQRAIGLWGARGTGKTTLLQQYCQERYDNVQEGLYISADNIHVSAMGLFNIAETFASHGGQLLVIDEVHKYPQWSIELKNIIDTFKHLQVCFSGSSPLALQQGAADLSRRIATYTLPGLSFREFLAMKYNIVCTAHSLSTLQEQHVQIAQQVLAHGPMLKYFQEYLRTGYYPFFLEGEHLYVQRLLRVIERIITEDIPAVTNIRAAKIPALKKLLSMIALSQPFEPNIDSMAKTISASREYTYYFIEYLANAGLLIALHPARSGAARVRKPGKIFLENTNLMHAISNATLSPGSIGAWREAFFANQMRTHQLHLGKQADFIVDGCSYEVGGKHKNTKQIQNDPNGFLAIDNTEIGSGNRIPLYLFGMLY